MRPLPHLVLLAACTGMAAIASAAAQPGEPDLDLAAIRARAAVEASEAEALAANARARAKAMLEEAQSSAADDVAHGENFSEQAAQSPPPGSDDIFDFDKMVADAGSMAEANLGEAPRFIAFASLSMPPASLRAMVEDVSRAGGVVVLRGLPGNSAKTLTTALASIAQDSGTLDNIGIDPRLFRAFGIEAVPTYVVISSDFDLCDGFDCQTDIPPHDRMSGNVSAHFALESFAQGGGPGALIAAQHLSRLTRSAP